MVHKFGSIFTVYAEIRVVILKQNGRMSFNYGALASYLSVV
jgi:hypothetical protein